MYILVKGCLIITKTFNLSVNELDFMIFLQNVCCVYFVIINSNRF